MAEKARLMLTPRREMLSHPAIGRGIFLGGILGPVAAPLEGLPYQFLAKRFRRDEFTFDNVPLLSAPVNEEDPVQKLGSKKGCSVRQSDAG